jgi:hypothetical protein
MLTAAADDDARELRRGMVHCPDGVHCRVNVASVTPTRRL